jgi:hypothetical protein
MTQPPDERPDPGWATPGAQSPENAAPPSPATGIGPPPQGPPGGLPPPPGWGGYSAYAAAGAPRPGIIPLRPLALGEILDGAFTVIRRYPRVTLGLSAVVAAISATITLVLQLALTSFPSISDNSAFGSNVNNSLSSFDTADIVARVIDFILDAVLTGMLTVVVSEAVLGRSTTARAVWARLRPRLLGLIGVSAAASLLPVLGLVLCIVPGVFLWAALALTVPAYVLEGQGIRAALGRSRHLVRGSWWRVFGIRLLGYLLVAVVSSILAVPFVIAGLATTGVFSGDTVTGTPVLFLVIVAIGSLVARAVTAPLLASILVLIYVDRRIRLEALDVSLIASSSS